MQNMSASQRGRHASEFMLPDVPVVPVGYEVAEISGAADPGLCGLSTATIGGELGQSDRMNRETVMSDCDASRCETD